MGKLLLILLVVAAAVIGFRQWKKANQSTIEPAVTSSPESIDTPKPVPIPEPLRAETPPASSEEEPEDPVTIVTYEFRNRRVPDVAGLISLFEPTGASVSIDQPSNRVFVVCPESLVPPVSVALSSLDAKQDHYRVEVILLSVQLVDAEEWSLDWLISVSGVNRSVPTAALSPGRVGYSDGIIDLSIERAVTFGRAQVLSRPSLTLIAGETASLSSGREVGIPVSNLQDGNVQTTIEFRRVALNLQCTLVAVGDDVSLLLEHINDEITGETEIEGSSVPEISSQQWRSELRPEIGRWYAVGGVASSSRFTAHRKGFALFSKADKSVERRELGLIVRVVPAQSDPRGLETRAREFTADSENRHKSLKTNGNFSLKSRAPKSGSRYLPSNLRRK